MGCAMRLWLEWWYLTYLIMAINISRRPCPRAKQSIERIVALLIFINKCLWMNEKKREIFPNMEFCFRYFLDKHSTAAENWSTNGFHYVRIGWKIVRINFPPRVASSHPRRGRWIPFHDLPFIGWMVEWNLISWHTSMTKKELHDYGVFRWALNRSELEIMSNQSIIPNTLFISSVVQLKKLFNKTIDTKGRLIVISWCVTPIHCSPSSVNMKEAPVAANYDCSRAQLECSYIDWCHLEVPTIEF